MRPRLQLLGVLAALTAGAALLRFWDLGHQGFWFDESDTAFLMHYGPGRMLGLLPSQESTPPVYFCIAWVWSRIFSDTEAGLRSLSALVGTLVVPALYLAGRRLSGSVRAGLLAALLAAANPLLIWYSQEARAYELLVLLCALAWLCFASALDAGQRRWLVLWGLCAAAALATEYYAVIVVVPQALVLLWRWRRRAWAWAAVAFAAAVGLALLPLLIAQNNSRNDAWIGLVSLGLRLNQVIPQFLLGTGSPHWQPLKWVCFALALIGLAGLALARPRRGLLAAALTLCGFVLALLFVAAGSDTLITRNLIGLWPGAALALAAGLAALEPVPVRRWLAPAAAAGLAAAGVYAVVGVDSTYALQRPDWRPLAAALARSRPRAGARLILVQHYQYDLPLELYMPKLGFAKGQTFHDVSQLDVIALGPEPGGPFCWWGAGCNLSPTGLQRAYPVHGFRPDGVSHVEQFSLMKLVAARPQTVTRAELAAALDGTTLHRDGLLLQQLPAI